MMLRHSLDQGRAADRIESAVAAVLNEGYRTADIQEPGAKLVGCTEMAAGPGQDRSDELGISNGEIQ